MKLRTLLKCIISVVLLLLSIIMMSSSSQAFNFLIPLPDGSGYRHDNSAPISYYINLGSLDEAPNRQEIIKDIQDALAHIENNPQIDLQFIYNGTTTQLPATDDVNIVYIADSVYLSGSYGSTEHINFDYSSNTIISADIVLLEEYDSWGYGFYAIMLHETMHFLGLNHSSTGFDSAVFMSTANLQMSVDDIAGLATLYPNPDNPLSTTTGTINGRVFASDGNPLDARIVAYDATKPQPRIVTRNTDNEGYFSLVGIPPGSYQVFAEKTSLGTYSQSIDFIHQYLNGGMPFTVVAGSELVAEELFAELYPPTYASTDLGFSVYKTIYHSHTGYIYLLGSDLRIHVLDPASGKLVNQDDYPDFSAIQAIDLSFSPDGMRLYAEDISHEKIHVIDTDPDSPSFHQVLLTFDHPRSSEYIEVSPNGLIYLNGNWDEDRQSAILVLDPVSGELLEQIPYNFDWYAELYLSQDGKRAYVAVTDANPTEYFVLEFDIDPSSPTYHTLLRRMQLPDVPRYIIHSTKNSEYIYMGMGDALEVRRVSDFTLVKTIATEKPVISLAEFGNGDFLAFIDYDNGILQNNQVVVLDTRTLEIVDRITIGGHYLYVEPGPKFFEVLVLGPSGLIKMPIDAAVTLSAVSGRVMDVSNTPIAGVRVSATGSDSATTDGDGYYTITGLFPGTYSLLADKDGYTFTPALHTVTVPPDSTSQDFTGMIVNYVYAPVILLPAPH